MYRIVVNGINFETVPNLSVAYHNVMIIKQLIEEKKLRYRMSDGKKVVLTNVAVLNEESKEIKITSNPVGVMSNPIRVYGYDKDASTETLLMETSSQDASYAFDSAKILATMCDNDALCIAYHAEDEEAEPFDSILIRRGRDMKLLVELVAD